MDSDREGNKQEGATQPEGGDPLSSFGIIFQSSRLRRNIQNGSRLDRFILASNTRILPYCWIISWIIFLLFKS